jgi:hypothetical protein
MLTVDRPVRQKITTTSAGKMARTNFEKHFDSLQSNLKLNLNEVLLQRNARDKSSFVQSFDCYLPVV